MTLDVVNEQNEKVDSIELSDEVFGGRVNASLVWESVMQQNAAERRGTHATKTRGQVSGSGSKPWRQKGTGRARVGEIRNPLWRKGGTVFGPQPRSYAYALPKKVVRGALRAALIHKLRDGAVTVIDRLSTSSESDDDAPRTKRAAELLAKLGVVGRAVLVDVKPEVHLERSVRNIPRVRVVGSNRLTARDVAGSRRLVMTKASVEHLAKVLAL